MLDKAHPPRRVGFSSVHQRFSTVELNFHRELVRPGNAFLRTNIANAREFIEKQLGSSTEAMSEEHLKCISPLNFEFVQIRVHSRNS
jgi:hypothetical protein